MLYDKGKQIACYSTAYPPNTSENFLYSFCCCCYIEKAWLFVCPTLLHITHQRYETNDRVAVDCNFCRIYINTGAFMNKYLYENSLLFLYSSSIQALRLKTIGIEFAFVPNPSSKSLYKVSMNTQCLFMSKFRPSNTKIPPKHHKQNN